jgi:hypothetical protein
MESAVREIARFDSYLDAVEAIFAEPWSDGLPIVPPTKELVARMIAAGAREQDEIVGTVPGRALSLFVWQAAACAVMAGCRPDYFPVVLASWEALLTPRFNLHTAMSSTGGAALAAIVSGPYAAAIGMNSGTGVFSPGNRANSTIGRAIRLGAMTVFQAIPGELDAGSYGHGGKYSFHFAESEPPAPWPSIREQLGFPRSATTVTVMPAEAPRQVMHRWKPSADDLLRTLAAPMRDPAQCSTGVDSTYIVALGPEHAGVLIDAGLTPGQVREALAEYSMITVDEVVNAGLKVEGRGVRYALPDENGRIVNARPERILVVTAGGSGAGWSTVIPCWTWAENCLPATRAVRLPGGPVAMSDPARVETDFA